MQKVFMVTVCTDRYEQICILPPAANADHVLYLRREQFGLHEDVRIFLEGLDGIWRICTDEGQWIETDDGLNYGTQHELRDTQKLLLVSGGDEKVALLTRQSADPLCGYVKYDLRTGGIITVGRSAGSMIRYDFEGTVSDKHAVLKKHADGWYFTDLGTNGSYLNGRRLEHTCVLHFGDRLSLAGLQMVFLTDALAVDLSSGLVQVNYLPRYKRSNSLQEKRTERGGEPGSAGKTALLQKQGPEGKRIQTDTKYLFHTSPRIMEKIETGEIKIDLPPALPQSAEQPRILALGPALTMAVPMIAGSLIMAVSYRAAGSSGGLFLYAGLVMAVLSALFSAIWIVMGNRYRRREIRAQIARREDAYSRYIDDRADELRGKAEKNAAALHAMYPEARVCATYAHGTTQLWNRSAVQSDFLQCRLGLGDIPFQIAVVVPERGFVPETDVLAEKPAALRERFSLLHAVPVLLDLKVHALTGIIGDGRAGSAAEIARVLAVQIAAAYSYTDVRMVFFFDAAGREDPGLWSFARWFPHTWSEDGKTRYVAATEKQRRALGSELCEIFRRRWEQADFPGSEAAALSPHFVIFVMDSALLKGELLWHYLLKSDAGNGLSTLILSESWEQLPGECSYIIRNDPDFRGMYNAAVPEEKRTTIRFDTIAVSEAETMARTLANIQTQASKNTGSLPQSLSFLAMFGAHAAVELRIRERWLKSRTEESLCAPIGMLSGGQLCMLDVHEKYHGPHGLIAGTTGAGKSELLQTWILSMAVHYSPEDVAFLIIDYKGGGMADLFEELPHIAGCISNLSGSQIRRALVSIRSEYLRRQRILSENKVNHIQAYTGMYRRGEVLEPLPHLFILVDEFAQLKKEEPDFLRELISVAQVGRSLGVHLLLATQRPAGTVDDNIRGNARFRLCLRVQDTQDSMDMLKKPDAAYLRQAGRCCFQVGNDELYEVFQAAWSGAVYEENGGKQSGRPARLLTLTGQEDHESGRNRRGRQMRRHQGESGEKEAERTQLEAVLEEIKLTAVRYGYDPPRCLWTRPLPGCIFLDEIEPFCGKAPDGELQAVVGILDDPKNQRQLPLRLSFGEGGHLAVVGGIRCGKSTFLQTLLYAFTMTYSPQAVNLYVIELSSHVLAGFGKAPHVGGIVGEGQEKRLARLMCLLEKLLTERKRQLRGGYFSQLSRSREDDLPAVFLVIDDYAAFREKTRDIYEEQMIRLSREGAGYGIFLVISAGGFAASELSGRIAENCTNVVALRLPDRYAYAEVLRTPGIDLYPENGVKGRGLTVWEEDVLEFQTALAAGTEDERERTERIFRICEEMAETWKGAPARMIPEIPEDPTWKEFCMHPDVIRAAKTDRQLPVGYIEESAGIWSLDLSHIFCYLITGFAHSGKKNCMKIMILSAKMRGSRIFIIDPGGKLKELSSLSGVDFIRSSEQMRRFLCKDLPELFNARIQKKRKLEEQGADGSELYEASLSSQAVFVFIPDMIRFLGAVAPEDDVSAFLETLIAEGQYINIYLIASFSLEKKPEAAGMPVFESFYSCNTGIHFGGHAEANTCLRFDHLSYQEQSVRLPPGIGFLSDEGNESDIKKIIVPLARLERAET